MCHQDTRDHSNAPHSSVAPHPRRASSRVKLPHNSVPEFTPNRTQCTARAHTHILSIHREETLQVTLRELSTSVTCGGENTLRANMNADQSVQKVRSCCEAQSGAATLPQVRPQFGPTCEEDAGQQEAVEQPDHHLKVHVGAQRPQSLARLDSLHRQCSVKGGGAKTWPLLRSRSSTKPRKLQQRGGESSDPGGESSDPGPCRLVRGSAEKSQAAVGGPRARCCCRCTWKM